MAAAAIGALAVPLLPAVDAVAAPVIGGGGNVSYTERSGPVLIGEGLTVSGGTSYAGKYVDFAVADAESTETLSLKSDATPVTANGEVSVVGRSIYLGNGSTADVIGSVDETRDGAIGRTLRVNFTSAFTNPSFENGNLTGWTAINSQIDLGVTAIAGCVSKDTSTYPGQVSNQDNNVPSKLGSLTSTVESGDSTSGSYALHLESRSMTTKAGYDVVHGPAVYSDPFEAAAGDKIYFDWRASKGEDDFHVFGYLVDANCNQIEVMNATGGTTTSWATKETVIPGSGTYRFVFVAGTFDATGGKAAGASLFIDNVRVYGTKASDAVVQDIARKLQYENTSHNPDLTRTVTVTAQSAASGSGSGTVTVDIAPVDDPPTLDAIAPVTATNSINDDSFDPVTGTLSASDLDGDPITFGIDGGTADAATIGGITYTHSKTGAYATVHVNASTGAWIVVPNDATINPRMTPDSETVTVTATAGGVTVSQPLTVNVAIKTSAPGAPTALETTADDTEVALTWQAPEWTGGSPITGYRIETSTDGVTWTAVAADTGSGATSYTVTGLRNGTEAAFRVSAINATGTGTPSAVATATPRALPGAPAITSVTPGDGTLTVAFTPGSPGTNPVLRYEYTLDGGTTWTPAAGTTSPITIAGLNNGTTYPVALRAVISDGAGAASAPTTGTPRALPGAPAITAVRPGNRMLTVSFTAGTSGTNPVLRYQYSLDGGTTWATAAGTSTPAVIRGLRNGVTYSVTLRAVSTDGAGAVSAPATGTPVIAPVLVDGSSGGSGTPDVPVGDTLLLIDGKQAPVTIMHSGSGQHVEGDGFSVDLQGVRSDGTPMNTDTRGKLVIETDGSVKVSGTGFKPGSDVDVWLFSTPYLLGTVTVGTDGSFAQSLLLPNGVQAGDHTVQLNGEGHDGALRSLSVGLVALAPATAAPAKGAPSNLPFTGADTGAALTLALALITAGGAALVATRRRQST